MLRFSQAQLPDAIAWNFRCQKMLAFLVILKMLKNAIKCYFGAYFHQKILYFTYKLQKSTIKLLNNCISHCEFCIGQLCSDLSFIKVKYTIYNILQYISRQSFPNIITPQHQNPITQVFYIIVLAKIYIQHAQNSTRSAMQALKSFFQLRYIISLYIHSELTFSILQMIWKLQNLNKINFLVCISLSLLLLLLLLLL
eukprot:TRINITY_DN1889_c1_g1_i16.p1 TRINITY_DN1889_c1_g1~~TRINITY_DN1889_c1_g1_i16.p1  ORF type:complete len:197 (-),score=-21.66 TRINITY_DN1889_c1_g1_i16:1021-1611(-)